MIIVDTDNAMGSTRGEVSDAFAVAALLKGSSQVAGICSVFGETTEETAHLNNRRLGSLLEFKGGYFRGARDPGIMPTAASHFLAQLPGGATVVALGPLSNLAAALAEDPNLHHTIERVILIGPTDSASSIIPEVARFGGVFRRDPEATALVMESRLRLTILPFDITSRLQVDRARLEALANPLGAYLLNGSQRAFAGLLRRFTSPGISVGPLAAAMFALTPELFAVRNSRLSSGRRGQVTLGVGERPIEVITEMDGTALWQRFAEIVASSDERRPSRPAPPAPSISTETPRSL